MPSTRIESRALPAKQSLHSPPQPRPEVKRRAYVIAVGVDATSDPSLRLGFAPHSAREIEQLLKEKLRNQYEVVTVPLISRVPEDNADPGRNLATKGHLQTVLNILSGREATTAQRQSLPGTRNSYGGPLPMIWLCST